MALAANVAVLAGVVLPLSASAEAAEQRAAEAAATFGGGQGRTARREPPATGRRRRPPISERFYGEVLPADVAAARRLTHLKLSQMARDHGVSFQRSSSSPEQVRDSVARAPPRQLRARGGYDDIRAFIYDVETAPDFLVIENVFLSEGQSKARRWR